MKRALAIILAGASIAGAPAAWSYFTGRAATSAPFSVGTVAASGGACPLSADASTLAAGSLATATLDCSTDAILHLGIPRGNTGATGSTGAPGPPGATGATGPAGQAGPVGPAGPAGAAGGNGTNGAAGTDCAGLAPQVPVRTCPGATGAAGATGPPGATGAQGPAGTNGVSGYSTQFGSCNTSSNCVATATCPAGTKPLGGGWTMSGFVTSGSVYQSAPTSNGWSVSFAESGGTNVSVFADVVCATVS